jgi:hypothetical protein
MFDGGNIIEFFNRLINTPDLGDEEVSSNVCKFYNYLCLTKMCNEETLNKLYKIVNCISEILVIRKEVGYFDVRTLFYEQKEKPQELEQNKPNNQQVQEKKEPDRGKKLTKKMQKPKAKPRKKPSYEEERHYSYFSNSGKTGCGGESSDITPKNWSWSYDSSTKTC